MTDAELFAHARGAVGEALAEPEVHRRLRRHLERMIATSPRAKGEEQAAFRERIANAAVGSMHEIKVL